MEKRIKKLSIIKLFLLPIFTLLGFVVQAQVNFKGKITGSNGVAITNASVQITPGNIGATTDVNGNYAIISTLKSGKYLITVSSIGFKQNSKVLNVTSNEILITDIILSADPFGLDEVIVTGTNVGTKKRQMVNAVSTISAREIEKSGATGIDGALQGKVAGAQINQNSGNPAGGVSVRLRGPSTIAGSSDPLYIVDGVIVNNDSRQLLDLGGYSQNRLVDLNPNDIERIEVIKGAAAAATYGSRASNGVVQIFTKRGKEGKPQFSFSSTLRSSSIRKRLEVTKTPFRFANTTASDLTKVDVNRYDYQDNIFINALGNETNISMSGGTATTKYFVSASNFYNQGIVKAADFNRTGIRLRINQKVGNTMTLSFGSNYVKSSSSEIPNGGINEAYGALTGFLFSNNIINPEKNQLTGLYPSVSSSFIAVQRTNPLEAIERFKFAQNTNRFINDVNINFKPVKGLTIDLTTGIDNYTQSATGFIPVINTTPTYNLGLSRRADVTVFQINTDLNISYNTAIKSWLQSTTSVGGTMQYDKAISFGANAQQLGAFGQTINNGTIVASEFREEKSIRGAFLQQTFGISDNLFINAAARVDASSIFGTNNKLPFYPKLGASYVLSNEKFWDKISNTVSFFKVRAAWGKSGNVTGIPTYGRFSNYVPSVYGTQTGYGPASLSGNTNISPEKQIEFEFGFDANLFKDRLGIELTVYNKKVEDLILNRSLAGTSGFLNRFVNAGNMTNKGIEFLIKAIAVKSKSFEWNSSVSYNGNQNKVTNVGGAFGTLQFSEGFGQVYAVNDQPLGAYFSTFFARNPDGSLLLTAPTVPGGPQFPQRERGLQLPNGQFLAQRDINGQPLGSTTLPIPAGLPIGSGAVLNKTIGNPLPKHVLSFINTFKYKNLELRMQWDGMYGFDVFNFSRRVGERDLYGGLKGYEKELNGEVPKGTSAQLFGIFENWIEKGDFTKLRELSLTYYLPNKFWKFRNASFTVAGRNLLAITNYSGYDPEVNAAGQSNAVRGFDFAEVPIPSTYSFTINLGF